MKWASWFRENWKELGITTALFIFVVWARGIILLQGHMIEDLQQQIATLEKWAGCQEKEGTTNRRYKFNWPTLECIEAGDALVTLDTLKQWEGCQEKEGLTDKRYKFDWQTLECSLSGQSPME